jgi:hypothetical protein
MKPAIRVERPYLAALFPLAGLGTRARVAAALEDKGVRIPPDGMMPPWAVGLAV